MSRPKSFALEGEIEGARRTFRLRPGLNRVGRHGRNQVVLRVDGVSRHHALIQVEPGGVSVEDLASKNGISVNGRRTLRGPLQAGDVLAVGPVELVLEPQEEALAIPPVAAVGGDTTAFGDSTLPALDPSAEAVDLRLPDGYRPGHSRAMRHLYWLISRLAPSALPVLVVGETGVGKEAVARALHLNSERRGPFLAINCAAIPAELLEAELFGIQARVATGVAGRKGLMAEAAGGTLLLDEVGEMPETLQSKLLRALQEQEVHPLGGGAVATDVRIVAATQSHLPFRGLRRDLYYRLAGGVLEIPPLRQRREDIPPLVEHFWMRAVEESGRRPGGLTAGALEALVRYPWPGNVRELEHEVLRLVQLATDSEVLTAARVEANRIGSAEAGEHRSSRPGEAQENGSDPAFPSDADLDLDHLERRALLEALRRSGGHRTRAAALLGITRHALRRRLERHGLTAEDEGSARNRP